MNLQDTRSAAGDVVDRTGVTYELAVDADGTLFTAFAGFGMQTTVLVDADGTVATQHTGALGESDLEALIDDHLRGGLRYSTTCLLVLAGTYIVALWAIDLAGVTGGPITLSHWSSRRPSRRRWPRRRTVPAERER